MAEKTTPSARDRFFGITRLEIVVAALVAALMLVLVLLEPDIVEAPFENLRTILFTVGGTVLAAIAFVVMLRLRVPPAARVVLLIVPFVAVNWWLISPYFIDDVVDEEFSTSISEQLANPAGSAATTTVPTETVPTETVPIETVPTETVPTETVPTETVPTETVPTETGTAPTGPVLLGAGEFVGLAGHSGTGDAGIFENPDGSLVLRFENFDIQNGPDLEVYLVPGADQTSLPAGSLHLGALKGNVGDQNYELPPGTELEGAYTALVWCEAFTVEFVGATVEV